MEWEWEWENVVMRMCPEHSRWFVWYPRDSSRPVRLPESRPAILSQAAAWQRGGRERRKREIGREGGREERGRER